MHQLSPRLDFMSLSPNLEKSRGSNIHLKGTFLLSTIDDHHHLWSKALSYPPVEGEGRYGAMGKSIGQGKKEFGVPSDATFDINPPSPSSKGAPPPAERGGTFSQHLAGSHSVAKQTVKAKQGGKESITKQVPEHPFFSPPARSIKSTWSTKLFQMFAEVSREQRVSECRIPTAGGLVKEDQNGSGFKVLRVKRDHLTIFRKDWLASSTLEKEKAEAPEEQGLHFDFPGWPSNISHTPSSSSPS